MFQKLYRHLEEINASLRKDGATASANETREKMLVQLEQLNSSIRSQERAYISGQRKLLRIAGFFIGFLVLCNAGLILVLVWKNPSTTTTHAFESSQAVRAPFTADAQRQNVNLQENILKLDTLVAEQAQSFRELKNLNTIAVSTLRRIRKHFAELDRPAAAGNSRVDSSVSLSNTP